MTQPASRSSIWPMVTGCPNADDSLIENGGQIPGSARLPAFSMRQIAASPIPILISAPHGGRTYPDRVKENLRNPQAAMLKLEDRYVDLIARGVAEQTGAAMILAHAPRAVIDLNRAVEDMDWTMIRRGPLCMMPRGPGGRRARSGLGLIPRRVTGLGELWRQPLDEADLQARIDGIHTPYHDALAGGLRALRDRWGAALLIDLHSMPPLATQLHGNPAPQFVVGDRFGSSCDGYLCAAAFDYFASARRLVSHNRPYAGGYILDRHARPTRGIHAMQIEVCRSTYLDSEMAEKGPGFSSVVTLISALVRRLALEVSGLGRGNAMPQAAE